MGPLGDWQQPLAHSEQQQSPMTKQRVCREEEGADAGLDETGRKEHNGSSRQRRLPPAHGSTFPAGQGRLCSFKSPPSQPTVSRKNLTRFFWWMLTDKLEQPVAFSIHFPHSPLGRLLMKEPIVPLQRSRQVGREQQWLREPNTAFAHLRKKKAAGEGALGQRPPPQAV